jgi:hypothetical protein
MRRFTGAERQKRLELARDAALQLVRPEGNVEIGGELQRFAEFRHNSIAIVYLSPRPGSWKSHLLTIREKGKVVFLLEWNDGQQLRSKYKPGEWGRVMRRCLKVPSADKAG